MKTGARFGSLDVKQLRICTIVNTLEQDALAALEIARPLMRGTITRMANRNYWGHIVTECGGWVFRWQMRNSAFVGVVAMATPANRVYYGLDQAPAVAQWRL